MTKKMIALVLGSLSLAVVLAGCGKDNEDGFMGSCSVGSGLMCLETSIAASDVDMSEAKDALAKGCSQQGGSYSSDACDRASGTAECTVSKNETINGKSIRAKISMVAPALHTDSMRSECTSKGGTFHIH